MYATHAGFCSECEARTTPEPTSATSVNLVGTSFVGAWDRCPRCGSIESLKVATLLVPVAALGRYRMIRFDRGGGSALLLIRRVPGPAMTRALWIRLGMLMALAVGIWGAFIAAIVLGRQLRSCPFG